MRKFLMLIILSVVLLQSYAIQIGEPEYNPKIIHPGDDVDLWVKIYNDNYDENNKVKNIVVSIKPHYPFELKQVNPVKGKVYIDSLNIGESYTAYFKLHVNENAKSGDYRIDISVSYDFVTKDGQTYHYNITKVYYLPIYGTADFEISGDFNLIPSKTQEVPITIKNTGTGTAKEVNIYIGYTLNSVSAGKESLSISEYGTTKTTEKTIFYPTPIPLSNLIVSPLNINKFYIGTLKPGDTKTINVKFYTSPNANEGVYSIPVVITWIDDDGSKKAEQISLGAYVKGDIQLDVSNVITEPKEIKAGDSYVRIDVEITNNGHTEAKNVKVNLKTSYPFKDSWSNCNIKDIGNLLPGASKIVSFYVDVDKDASSQHYKLPLIITYLTPSNKLKETTKYIDIYIKPKPMFEILTKNITVIAGKENKVLIKIKNIGGEKAERVRISAIKNSGQPFDYPVRSDLVGTLYPNETGIGAIVIKPDSNAISKPYIITLEIRCAGDSDEGDYNVYVYYKPLKVYVKNSKSNFSFIVLGIILLIILGVVYYFKKRNNKSLESN